MPTLPAFSTHCLADKVFSRCYWSKSLHLLSHLLQALPLKANVSLRKLSEFRMHLPSPCTSSLSSGWKAHLPAEVTKSSSKELARRQQPEVDPAGKSPSNTPTGPQAPSALAAAATLVTLRYNCLHVGLPRGQ